MTESKSDTIAVLMAAHNRKEKTLTCLRLLYDQEAPPPFDVFLVDDGSTDGTAEAVLSAHPNVKVIQGNGSLFWVGGMNLAWNEALKENYNSYLWLNDDVKLDTDALSKIWTANEKAAGSSILGGAMRGEDGNISYAASLREGYHPFHFKRVEPDPLECIEVDVLNGNLVLVPDGVAKEIGGFAPYLIHLAGDYEYGLRARRQGISVKLLAGTLGVCPKNPAQARIRGMAGFRRATSFKCLPINSGVPLYREHGGPFWWLWLTSFYAKAFLKGI